MEDLGRRLLDRYQRGFPLAPRPYAEVAAHLGRREGDVIAALETLGREGAITRVGAVIRPGAIGAGTLAGGPDPDEVLAGIAAPEVYVVPFFMTDGSAVRDILPRRLGLEGPVTERDGRRFVLCAPVGLNAGLAELILRRARALAGERAIAPEAATLLLVGHGSTRNPASRRATEAHAARARNEGVFAAVATAFLDQPPALAETVAALEGPAVAVGLFTEDGLHASQDIPLILAGGRPVVPYLGAIGPDPEMADLIVEQVRAVTANS